MSILHLQPKNQSEAGLREIPQAPAPHAYIDLPGLRHETRDVLKQLDANIQLLEDMSGRLGFVLSEIRTLIRR